MQGCNKVARKVFLALLALVLTLSLGLVACGGAREQQEEETYDLTISSTSGGLVTTPGEGSFSYDGGAVVNLVAETGEDHRFVNWAGDVDTIANINAAETTITLVGDCDVTARFVAVGDSKTEAVTNGIVDAKAEADTEVLISGNAIVTVARFTDDPGGEPPTGFSLMGKYVDVYVPDVADVTEVEIRLYYTASEVPTGIDEESLRLFWWNGIVWEPCGLSGVNTTDRYIWAQIRSHGSTPTLAQLTGTPFDGGASPVTLVLSSTTGGHITIPPSGEGTYYFSEGYVVPIRAEAEECYQFVGWSGDVDTVVDINAAETTLTMQGNYSVAANFEAVEVTFVDPNLEAAIREAINVPTDQIYSTDLDGLTVLAATDRGISDLTGLECATSLALLSLGANQISDISPLANLTNLITLKLDSNQISDISPLANLTGLRYLLLQDNQIEDISPLANLINLPRLKLSSNQISDISPLADLASLTELNLDSNQVSDISPLASLTSLAQLNLDSNQVSDISPLANITGLTELHIQLNQISDISSLANLTSLIDLNLDSNQIGDISPLDSLTKLRYLLLQDNQIENISPLANLVNLTRLYLSSNQISDISSLGDLTSLAELHIRHNQVSDISSLANLTSLRELGAEDNPISNISHLANLTSLTVLGLEHDQISDISSLANLTSLTALTLSGNQISNILPLANLTSLTVLDLGQNEISDISPLTNLTSLTRLGLWNNQIESIAALVLNEGLGEGDEVWLDGNPLNDDSINTYIPQLEDRGVTVHVRY